MTSKTKPKAEKQERARLSNDYVARLARPAKGAVTHWDNDPKAVGFGVRVYSTGTRSLFLNYWIEGIEKRHTIGQFPRWSVSVAREHAIDLRRQIDKGHDPAGEKRARREAPTIADLIERYKRDHLPTKSQTKMRLDDEKRQLEMIGEQLGRSTKVAEVHGGDIQKMHRRITESGRPVRANRVLACASKMFSLSLVPLAGETLPWRNAVLGNPCKGIARNREEGRERFFNKSELERIAEALSEYPPEAYASQKKPGKAAADCVRLIMLTGCRPNEAMQAEWPEFDKKAGFWIKPSHHTKQQKIHRLPLSPPAIQLIDRLRKDRSSIKWVFPGRESGQPVQTLLHVWNFVRERAQLEPDEKGRPARVYDLRHSFASLGVTERMSLPLIGRLLGHTQARTTQRYAHIADDPLKEAADKIGNAIAGAGKGGEVVPIRGGAA
jgi:integrase